MIEAAQFEAEVREPHASFQRWCSGAADPDEIVRVDSFADSSVMIGPDGRERNGQQVREFVEAAFGNRSTKLNIRDAAVRPNAPTGTYEE